MRIIGCDLHARQQTRRDRAGVLFRTAWPDSGGDRSDRLDAVERKLFRSVQKDGGIWGLGLTQNVVWYRKKMCTACRD
jgi:hypothetical protein